MMRGLLLFYLFTITLFAMQIDIPMLENIIKNDSEAYKERLILAKYYETKGDDTKAISLVNEALSIKPKDKSALNLKKILRRKEEIKTIFKEASIDMPVDREKAQEKLQTYYENNNYQFYSNLYQALIESKIDIDDSFHIKAAYIYLWDGRYTQAKKSLRYVKQKNNIDKAKIKADICYFQGDYICAIHLYEKLYNSSYDLDYALKLINSYIFVGKTEKAQRLYTFLARRYPDSRELQKLGEKLDDIKIRYISKVKNDYEKTPNYKTLENYVSVLSTLGRTDEILELLKEHNKKMPSSESLLLEAKYLTWSDHSTEALKVLQSEALASDLDAKLMLGKIYSWDHKFEEAKRYLDEVLLHSQDANLRFEAKKALAYIDMWEKRKRVAEKKFEELLKIRPKDKEIKEALMELKNDYSGLIEIYKQRVGSNANSNDVKRLADLYMGNKEPLKAIKYLKQYIKQNPEDLESMKTLALLLIDNKEYYQGFGYLEYYAVQKHDAASRILLAKYYYWNGFAKEAIDVLSKLLEEEPQNREALELKAKILKISPRFTTSNSGATIGMYYDELGKTQLKIADSLYFNAHYEASLMYYENYIKNHPTDAKARLRYAYALEYSQWYGKAEGEFALLLWVNDGDEIKYHYAFNMMKNGKYKEAKKELLALKKQIYKKASPNIEKFIEEWKRDWESQNYTKYIRHYSKKFTDNETWAFRKQRLFSTLKYIAIGVYDPVYKEIDKNHYKVRFFQEYATNERSDKGYKTLEILCSDDEKECKILNEEWRAGKYHKERSLEKYIDNVLKEIKRLESSSRPLAMKKMSRYSKKKILFYCVNQRNIMIST